MIDLFFTDLKIALDHWLFILRKNKDHMMFLVRILLYCLISKILSIFSNRWIKAFKDAIILIKQMLLAIVNIFIIKEFKIIII